LPSPAVAFLLLGGLLYTVGAVIYALRRPDPSPHVFGYHEVFHLFVIGGRLSEGRLVPSRDAVPHRRAPALDGGHVVSERGAVSPRT